MAQPGHQSDAAAIRTSGTNRAATSPTTRLERALEEGLEESYGRVRPGQHDPAAEEQGRQQHATGKRNRSKSKRIVAQPVPANHPDRSNQNA